MDEIFSELKVLPLNPLFYSKAFSRIAKRRKEIFSKEGNNFKRVCAEEYTELSYRLDRSAIQESCSVRNVLRTRRLANLLVDDQGELNLGAFPSVISSLKENLYSLGPERQHDAKRQVHILNVLQILKERKELQRLLKQISKPISHRQAEQIIRDTLQVEPGTLLTDAHARRAALSAWFCTLRQSVGSCFATAPAIMIHDEQPEQFLKDLNELLNTGRLKRTFGGNEYTVPLSFSWGSGDLKKRFLLRRDLQVPSLEIWQSPGLVNALKAVGIFEESWTSQKCRHTLKEMVTELLAAWEEPGEICVVSAEMLLRKILLQHHQLTEQDVTDYLNRPQGMIHSGLLMHVTKAGSQLGGKGSSCALFLQNLDIAESAFKALADNALLKAWEFSLASFCDIKTDFSRWNLYSSLGLGAEEPGGIGRCLYKIIQQKLDQANAKVAELQTEYEQVFAQVKYIESRIKNASTEKEVQWLRVEYQSRMQEFYTFEEIRNKAHSRAKMVAGMFEALIDIYLALFPNYFQEVYDADMQDVSHAQYDDSPAGFRLVYKHGRANTSQWTMIHTPNEFIQSLTAFFVSTENEISSDVRFQGFEDDLSDVVTYVVNHVRTQEFLETAFHRMAIYHKVPAIKDPLDHLDRIEKKPWAYTSGGTMDTLLSCYYKREQKPTQVSRWVESPTELIVFLEDTLRQIPYKETEEFSKQPDKVLLMHSPTHAFLLKPGLKPFREGWQSDAFTYTWIRDQWIHPSQKFIEQLRVDEQMMQALIQKMKEKVPADYRHGFEKAFERFPAPSMRAIEFRNYVVEKIQYDSALKIMRQSVLAVEDIDSMLYSSLPMFQSNVLRERIERVFQSIPEIPMSLRERALRIYDDHFDSTMISEIINAKSFMDICKLLIALASEKTSASHNYPDLIACAAQRLGFAMPKPVLFADTNWVRDYFGFVVNPGTGKFELWRLDCLGTTGTPMPEWRPWLDGSRRDATWGVYTRYPEYRS